ncbi:MAG: prenyltransferase/squalene oxidase repeat-containing protein [Planctomycetia bacterium]
MRRCLTLLALALLMPLLPCGRVLRADEDPAARKARAAAEEARLARERAVLDERVAKAIERGTAWLQRQQRPDGSYPGFADRLDPNAYNPMDVGLNALVMLTLAHGGLAPEHDAVKKCMRFCQFHYAGGNGSWNLKGNGTLTVYSAAVLVLALDALYRGAEGKPPPVRRDRYGEGEPPKPVRCKYPDSVRKWIVELVEFIVGCQHETGGWRYPGNPVASEPGDTDLSNTQYALLALEAAARSGIAVPPATFEKAAAHALGEQEQEGLEAPVWQPDEAWLPGDPPERRFRQVARVEARGWTYLPGHASLPTGSMTTAGVAVLAICKERLWALERLPIDLRKRLDRGLRDGVTWLGEHFAVDTNPDQQPQWHYYYLYGLERAGTKLGLAWLGTHDWYREGAEHLLAAQQADGGWLEAAASGKPADSTESAITQTCFALLFLKRATRVPPVPLAPPAAVTGEGGAPAEGR